MYVLTTNVGDFMSYKVAKGASVDDLELSVAELEAQGYFPQGGIMNTSGNGNGGYSFTYLQAMYKKNIVEITSPE